MPNFDPKRTIALFDSITRFLEVPVQVDGEDAGTVQLPEADIQGLSEDGIREAALRTYHLARVAEEMVPPEWLAPKPSDTQFVNTVIKLTTALVVSNAGHIYIERANADPQEAERFAEGALDDAVVWERAEARIRPLVLDTFEDTLNQKSILTYLHQHVIAWALMDLEKALGGAAALAALPDDDFSRRLQDHVLNTMDLKSTCGHVLNHYSQHIARAFLDALDPENLPIETLRSFLGLDSTPAPDLGDVPTRAATRLPATMRQWTFQEARALTIALADGPALRYWAELPAEIALRHAIPDQPLQTKFAPSSLLSNWWGAPATYDGLRSELQDLGIPAVLLLHVGLGLALETAQVTIALDELVRAVGWTPRSTAERASMRQTVWRWLLVFDSMTVVGKRPGYYKDPRTGTQLELTSVDALIRITGQREATQPALDASAPPLEVTFVAGPWLDQWRGNARILHHFGDVRRLAAIPAGRPSGAWAQGIGLSLQQRWREFAAAPSTTLATTGEEHRLTVQLPRPFTRRELLSLFRAKPDFEEILGGDKPHRAKEYWNEAVAILLGKRGSGKLIGYYAELEPLPAGRQGWQAAWETQPLDIRPNLTSATDMAAIARKAANARKKAGRARGVRSTRASTASQRHSQLAE